MLLVLLDRNEIRHTMTAYESTRKDLIRYVTTMKEKVGETGLTVHEILTSNCVRTQLTDWLPRAAIDARLDQPELLNSIVRRGLSELSQRFGVASDGGQQMEESFQSSLARSDE